MRTTSRRACAAISDPRLEPALWKTGGREALVYTPAPAARPHGNRSCTLSSEEPQRETHLPAERSPPEAQARLSRAHVDARRPRDPQAPARQGPQAPLRLRRPSPCSAGTDCPARGTSTPSTGRAVGLDAVPDAALVPPRGRSRRRAAARARRAEVGRLGRDAEPGEAAAARDLASARRRRPARASDYVLVARPGLAEPARGPRAASGSPSRWPKCSAKVGA